MVGRVTGGRGTTSTGSTTPQPAAVKAATKAKLLKAFDKLAKAGSLHYGNTPPAGVRFVRVPLKAENHPDGFSYTALIPVGALRPGVKPLDPNKAKDFVIERSGGFAGITQYAGPFSISGNAKAADPFFSRFLGSSNRSGSAGNIGTEKFPSDNEDHGGGGSGGRVGGGGSIGTEKFPSDNEDHGGGSSGGRVGGGGSIGTEKFPSDNEDGGGGRTSGGGRSGGGGAISFTEKYPSDNDE
jgi:hypothetical protein